MVSLYHCQVGKVRSVDKRDLYKHRPERVAGLGSQLLIQMGVLKHGTWEQELDLFDLCEIRKIWFEAGLN